MNKQFEDVITKVKALPEERQQQAAALLVDFLDQEDAEIHLTAEQIAEIERALSDDEPYASDEEVCATFNRLTK